MGWFLSSNDKKKRKTATSRSRKRADQPQWDPQRTMLGLKVAAVVLVGLTAVMSWRWSETRLTRYAQQTQAVTTSQVELVNAPAWMSPMLKREMQVLVASEISSDPLDGHSLGRAAAALAASPWVEQVHQIWRLPEGQVAASAAFRQPVAVVQGQDGYHLLDPHGVRLPGIYLQHQLDDLNLPLIVGASQAPLPAGQVWPGQDLQAGLALVRLISHEPYMEQVTAVDVSHRDSRGRVRLTLNTDRGMVRWGLPPFQEQAIEPPAQVKLERLIGVYQQRGSIDAGGRVVDLYGAAVFVHPAQTSDAQQQVGYTW